MVCFQFDEGTGTAPPPPEKTTTTPEGIVTSPIIPVGGSNFDKDENDDYDVVLIIGYVNQP